MVLLILSYLLNNCILPHEQNTPPQYPQHTTMRLMTGSGIHQNIEGRNISVNREKSML